MQKVQTFSLFELISKGDVVGYRCANLFVLQTLKDEVLIGLYCNITNKFLGYNSIFEKENIFLR
jgi:hypothetical protein